MVVGGPVVAEEQLGKRIILSDQPQHHFSQHHRHHYTRSQPVFVITVKRRVHLGFFLYVSLRASGVL